MKSFEKLKTTIKIAGQVLQRRAFVETLIPSKRNYIKGEIVRCTCTDEEKLLPTFHAFAENEVDQVCPKGLAKGEFVEGWNSRVDAGAAWQASLMGSAAGTPANYMALAAAAITVTKTDTFIGSNASNANEITANGCARALTSYAYTGAPSTVGGSTSFVLSKTFTCTPAPQTVAAVALFNASSVGALFAEANLTTVATLSVGDSIFCSYSINI